MVDSSPYTMTHFPFSELNSPIQQTRKSKGKSFTNFLCKSLFFVLCLIALPLFPSQAPDFVNQTILTKFWELLHLLFIGIAVSYGLFGRRNVEVGIEETHPHSDISQSYGSRIFNVSSIFDNGFDNPCGSEEKSLLRWNSQHIESDNLTVYANSINGDEEKCKTEFFMPESGSKISYGCDQDNVVQAWNSQYFQHEPVVVVAKQNYGLDQWGKPISVIDYKPLGLPVRSLNLRARKADNPKFISESQSGSGSKGSSKSSNRSRSRDFGNLGPVNLEQKFNEAAAVVSPIPWRSRSIRMERRDKVGTVNRPWHFRPLSVDETQFESLKSRSFRSTESFSSQASSISPSHSVSSELPNSSMEDLGKNKSFRRDFHDASPSPPKPIKGKASTNALHSRHDGTGSIFGSDSSRSSADELKEWSRTRREESLGSDESWMDSRKLNLNPASPTKASLRGKSVRTIRAKGLTAGEIGNEGIRGNQIDDKIEEKCHNLKEVYTRKDETKARLDSLMTGSSKQNLDNFCPMPKATFSKYDNDEKEEVYEKVASESEEETESEDENFQVSSDECELSGSVNINDAGPDSDEVDKKAGEFIAKFREQIMLQKMASVERSRGLQMGRNYFR